MAFIKSRKHVHTPPAPAQAVTATLLTGLALGAPMAASAASANGPAADAQATTLDSVEVRGQRLKRYSDDQLTSPKFTQPLVDTTRTVNVIGSDLFNEQGATTLTEALRNSPGVSTFYAGENGNTTTGDAVRMRGFDSSGSIFVDGVRDLGSISRDMFNIEQVEVIKGPAGSDYGRTSPTGSINLVSKHPFLHNTLSSMVSYGSADHKRVTADWNHVLGESSAMRVNVMAHASGVPGRDVVENKRWGFAPSFAFGLGSKTRVYFDLLHVQQENIPDGGVFTIGLPGYASPDPARPEIGNAPPVDPENFYGTLQDHDDVTADMVTLRVEHALGSDTLLTNTTRWGQTRQNYMLTAFMGSVDRLVTPDIDDRSTWTIPRNIPTFKDQANEILTNQTNLVMTIKTGSVRHDISTGLELIREELETRGIDNLVDWPDANVYNPDPNVGGLLRAHNGARSQGRTDTVAVYLFDTVELNRQWQVNGGIRFDHYDTQFSSLAPCGGRRGPDCAGAPDGTIVPDVTAEASDTLFNWNLGVLFKPTGNGSLYANYAVSQQPPGGAELELSNRDRSADNPIYDPQKARTAEIGTKWEFNDGDLLLTAALYDTRVSNEVVRDPVDQLYYQVGRKQVRGIELGAVGRISEHWMVSAGYTTMDTEITEGPTVTADGSRVIAYTPEHAFTAWSTYQFANGLNIGGGARYMGELTRGSDGAVGTPTHTDDYWVFDAVASYDFNDHFGLRLNVYNLFDEEYVAAINKSGYRYTPGTPRSVLLTADFHF